MTSSPRSARRRETCIPMKPAAPVTRTFMRVEVRIAWLLPASRCGQPASRPVFLGDTPEIFAVAALRQRLRQGQQSFLADRALAEPAAVIGDFLDTGDLQSLPTLDRLDEVGCLEQRLMRTGVEPGIAAAERYDLQLALPQVLEIDVGNLELAARGGLELRGDVDNVVVVEIESD